MTFNVPKGTPQKIIEVYGVNGPRCGIDECTNKSGYKIMDGSTGQFYDICHQCLVSHGPKEYKPS